MISAGSSQALATPPRLSQRAPHTLGFPEAASRWFSQWEGKEELCVLLSQPRPDPSSPLCPCHRASGAHSLPSANTGGGVRVSMASHFCQQLM